MILAQSCPASFLKDCVPNVHIVFKAPFSNFAFVVRNTTGLLLFEKYMTLELLL
jgi:hypothetical protein